MLGSLLLVPEMADEVALILRPDVFYADVHCEIYTQMLAIHEQGKRIDTTLLCERLKAADEFDGIGGYAYLAELAGSVPTAANAEYYAQIVREKATLRGVINACTEVLRDTYQAGSDARTLLNRAEERLFAVHDSRWSGEVRSMHDVLTETFAHIDARAQGGMAGVPRASRRSTT